MDNPGCGVDFGASSVLQRLDNITTIQKHAQCEISLNDEYFEFSDGSPHFSKQHGSNREPSTAAKDEKGTDILTSSTRAIKQHDALSYMKYKMYTRLASTQYNNYNAASLFNPAPVCPYSFRSAPKLKDSAATEKVKDWGVEYDEERENNKEMIQSAKDILESLAWDRDPKLRDSRFIAYLQSIVGEQKSNMLDDVQKSMMSRLEETFHDESVARVSAEWEAMEKGWRVHAANGFGYDDWARTLSRDFSSHVNDNQSGKAYELHLNRVQTDPHCPQSWFRFGAFLQSMEDDAQAIQALQRAVQSDPSHLDSYVALASSLANECCVPEAVRCLGAMISKLDAIEFKGTSPFDLLKSLKALTESAGLESSARSVVLTASSITNCLLGNYPEAFDTLLQLNNETTDRTFLNRLGAIQANMGDYEDALKTYSRVPDRDDCPRLRYNRGISLLSMGQCRLAKREFITSLKLTASAGHPSTGNTLWDALELASEMDGDTSLLASVQRRNIEEVIALASIE